MKSDETSVPPGATDSLDTLMEQFRRDRESITGVRGPREDQTTSYNDLIQSVDKLRGRGLFYPYLSSGRGNGPLVELADGSVKYDFALGIGVHGLGHGHPGLTRAMLEAALDDTVMQGNLQQNPQSIRLMERFLEVANRNGAGMDHCFLTSSGAMANENALKMLFHRREQADRVLTFDGAFSGRTLALAQVTDKPNYRVGLPETLTVDRIPFPAKHEPDTTTAEALDALDRLLKDRSEQYGCMMMELIQGEAGFYPIDPDFLERAVKRLEEAGLPLLVDEVQSFGRTTHPFTFQKYGIDRHVDIVTVGKLSQTCATIYRNRWNPDPGLISQTFTSSSTAIRAGYFVLDELEHQNCFGEDGTNQTVHRWAVEQLKSIRDDGSGRISGPFGCGSLVGFQIGNGDKQMTLEFLHDLFERGVIGFLAGEDPTRVRFFLPAPVLKRDDLEQAFALVEESLAAVGSNQ